MSTTSGKSQANEGGSSGRRVTTEVPSMASVIGAHPDALRAIYQAGRPADPAELGDAPRGSLLAFADKNPFFLLTRPVIRAIAGGILPWKGMTFDHGGNSGQNVILGKPVLRFHAEIGPSVIDGKHALLLTYGTPGHRNPWPFSAMVEELRSVGPGIALGPAMFALGGSASVLFWIGLEAS